MCKETSLPKYYPVLNKIGELCLSSAGHITLAKYFQAFFFYYYYYLM